MLKTIETRNVDLAIHNEKQTGFYRVSTPAEVYDGILCIHLDVVKDGKGPQGPKWTISHVSTGMLLFHGLGKQEADRCIRFLLSKGAEIWQWGEFGVMLGRRGTLMPEMEIKANMIWELRNEARDMDFTKPAKVNTSRLSNLFKSGKASAS